MKTPEYAHLLLRNLSRTSFFKSYRAMKTTNTFGRNISRMNTNSLPAWTHENDKRYAYDTFQNLRP